METQKYSVVRNFAMSETVELPISHTRDILYQLIYQVQEAKRNNKKNVSIYLGENQVNEIRKCGSYSTEAEKAEDDQKVQQENSESIYGIPLYRVKKSNHFTIIFDSDKFPINSLARIADLLYR